MSNKLGSGFHVELLLKTNKESFDQGRKAIDGVGIGVTNLLGTVRTAVPLIVAGLTAINGQTEKTANTGALLGLGVKTMDAWGAAAKKAGVNVGGLTSGLSNLDDLVQKLQDGSTGAGEQIAKALGWLGLNDLSSFTDLNPQQRVHLLFKQANEALERERQQINAKQKSGVYSEAVAQEKMRQAVIEGKNHIAAMIGQDWGMVFAKDALGLTNFWGWVAQAYEDSYGADENKARIFDRELEDTLNIMKEISKYSGTEFGAAFTPLLKELNEFLREHKGEIKSTITDLADSLGVIATAIGPFAGETLRVAIESIKELTGAIAALFKQDWKGAADRMKAFFSVWGINSETMNKIEEVRGGGKSGADIRHRLLAANVTIDKMGVDFIEEYLTEYDSNEQFRAHLSWAEAAPNIKKAREKLKKHKDQQKIYENQIKEREYLEQMKKSQEDEGKEAAALLPSEEINEELPALLNSGIFTAFLPNAGNQTVNAGGNIIQQTININGDSDPFTVKQAAYDGASTGLIQAQAAGLDKLQLMSGIA